jgi:hypothetical protein
MKVLRKLFSGLLQLIAMSVLLLGSCVGPGLLYVESPKWALEPYDAEKSRMFFVAFQAKDDKGHDALRATLLRQDPAKSGYTDISYQLPEGRHIEHREEEYYNPPASIEVNGEPGGSQLVKVYVRGDTPWASLSEYRVKDNIVQPLRYGHSDALFFLIGIPLCLIGVHYLMKPIRRRIQRMVGLAPNTTSPPAGPDERV